MARWLAIRYCWIDALCIVQNAPEDKALEISQMQSVFGNEACNLAASASHDPQGGLLRPRNAADVAPGSVAAQTGALRDEMHHLVDTNYLDRQILTGPLHKRGWVGTAPVDSDTLLGSVANCLGVLSELKCEGFPHGMLQPSRSVKNLLVLGEMHDARQPSSSSSSPPSPPPHQGDPQKGLSNGMSSPHQHQVMSISALRVWHSLVRDYSSCALTLSDDRLPAFSGVADLLQRVIGDQHLAGLWRTKLLHLLDWWIWWMDQLRTVVVMNTWISVDGPIRPRFAIAQSRCLASVTAVQTSTDGSAAADQQQQLACPAETICLHLTGRLVLQTQDHQPMRCDLYPDTLEITLGVPGPFYFPPLQTFRHQSLPRLIGQNTTKLSSLILEPVLCMVPVPLSTNWPLHRNRRRGRLDAWSPC